MGVLAFSKNGFHSLFNQFTGFEIVELQVGLPCKPYALTADKSGRLFYKNTMNTAVAVLAKKVSDIDQDAIRWKIETKEIVDDIYPSR